MNKLTQLTVALLLAGGLSGCGSTTSDEVFSRDVRVHLSASDRYDLEKTVFRMEFSTRGDTIWPGNAKLALFVDGKETMPPGRTEWTKHNRSYHIIPQGPRAIFWWLTLPEIQKWIGTGDHKLHVQFRNVKSNALAIHIPKQGRIQCAPELDVPSWTKER